MDSSPAGAATGRVVLIGGPPGAGKSTVARRLAERRSDRPTICLETDWFWTTVATGFIDPWLPEADRQNRVLLRAAATSAATLAAGGFDVVVEGVLGPWMLDEVSAPFAATGIDPGYVILVPDLATCLDRARGRADEAPRVAGHPPLTDSGPIRAMWHQFADLGDRSRHVLDTTGLDPARTVDAAERAIATGSMRLGLTGA